MAPQPPTPHPVHVGFLGPEGTFSHAAALMGIRRGLGLGDVDTDNAVPVAVATIHEVVMSVARGDVDLGVVPIENAIEGSVSVTLDALALDAPAVRIVAEAVVAIEQCLVAAAPLALSEITHVVSHPQASGQCAAFLRRELPRAVVVAAASTADAVRQVTERPGWAALGPRLAAERYGATLLAQGVEDHPENVTRFVWLRREGEAVPVPRPAPEEAGARWKTSIVFWGDGTGRPGWLVRCLSELSDRGVNLTRIESRPRREGLGLYLFFADCEGSAADPPLAEALAALAGHVEVLRSLGSYPSAT